MALKSLTVARWNTWVTGLGAGAQHQHALVEDLGQDRAEVRRGVHGAGKDVGRGPGDGQAAFLQAPPRDIRQREGGELAAIGGLVHRIHAGQQAISHVPDQAVVAVAGHHGGRPVVDARNTARGLLDDGAARLVHGSVALDQVVREQHGHLDRSRNRADLVLSLFVHTLLASDSRLRVCAQRSHTDFTRDDAGRLACPVPVLRELPVGRLVAHGNGFQDSGLDIAPNAGHILPVGKADGGDGAAVLERRHLHRADHVPHAVVPVRIQHRPADQLRQVPGAMVHPQPLDVCAANIAAGNIRAGRKYNFNRAALRIEAGRLHGGRPGEEIVHYGCPPCSC